MFDKAFVQGFLPLMPMQQTVTLFQKVAGETYSPVAGTQFPGSRPRKATKDDYVIAQLAADAVTRRWIIPSFDGCPVPRSGSVVQGADGVRWTVRHVDTLGDGAWFGCVCIQEK